MSLIPWQESYNLNIETIDTQHRKLIAEINAFFDVVRTKEDQKSVEKKLKSLVKYTVFHFAQEEKYMKQFGYSGYKDHVDRHDDFRKKILEIMDSYKKVQYAVSGEVALLVKDWIRYHIMEVDKQYVQTFKENGVK